MVLAQVILAVAVAAGSVVGREGWPKFGRRAAVAGAER